MGIKFTKLTVIIFCPLLILLMMPGCRRPKDADDVPQLVKTKTGIEMVVIPGGFFDMGSSKGASDESPVHKVWIDSFWMDRFEVVQEQFKKYQISDPSHFKNPKNPLEQINWTDATIYCNERSLAEGLEPCYDEETWQCDFQANGYRLPTEAEWEYACRAGTTTKYCFGNDARKLRAYSWFAGNSSGKTKPVGQKKPNLWGLYDMHGNVAEWCNDFYSENYYKNSPQKNPRGPAKGRERVLRGGAWNSTADSLRSSCRASDPSIDDTCLASDAIGFRCVKNVPNNKPAEKNNMVKKPHNPSKTGFVYDDIYLEHKTTPDHPEAPQRLVAIVDRLKQTGLYSQLLTLTPYPAKVEWLKTVHSPEYVQRAENSCRNGTRFLDSMDTPISPKSYDAALMAVGGVFSAIDAVMQKKIANAFCAVRPPGHHAVEDAAMGFCMFNNVAIGARYIQKKYNLSKILIVDWDVHHGNGTQAAFYDDPNVLYFSVHRYPFFYPGTGGQAEKGSGKGLNYNINVPLPAGSTDADYIEAFKEKLEPAALTFSPDFVLISAGFDAHENDLLGGMKVTTRGFAQLTAIVKTIAQKCCENRLVAVLEGGYDLEGLADAVEAHINVLIR